MCKPLLVCSTFRAGCPVGNSCECDSRLKTNESDAQDQFNTILTSTCMSSTWSLTFMLSFQKFVWFPLQCVLHHHLWFYLCNNIPLPMARQPLVGHGLLIVEASRSHSDTQQSFRTPMDGWSARQRPLPDNSQHSRERHPCTRLDSNPQSQLTNGRTPTP